MRLIDANKLKAHYEWWDFSDDDDRRNKHIFDSIVDLQPTADVVEVVRCKECVYNQGHFTNTLVKCGCGNGTHHEGFFCADGERGDDGEVL